MYELFDLGIKRKVLAFALQKRDRQSAVAEVEPID